MVRHRAAGFLKERVVHKELGDMRDDQQNEQDHTHGRDPA